MELFNSNRLSGSLTCLVYIIDTHSWMTTNTVSLIMCAGLALLKATATGEVWVEEAKT